MKRSQTPSSKTGKPRAPRCEGVIMRVVKTPTHIWFEATGATSIAVAHE